MGRNLRIEYYGAIYHIKHLCNNKIDIFESSSDKIELLNIIGEVKELFDFFLIGYCIMDDHYHLAIRTHNIPISKIMHRINTFYAKYFNKKHNRTGSLFNRRYKSTIVDNEYNLSGLINYIHNYPFNKKVVDNMTEYKWSSDVFYRMNIEGMVNISYLLDTLSEDRLDAIDKYKELMKLSRDDIEKTTYLGARHLKMEEILKGICNNENDQQLIKSGSKKAYLMGFKKKFIKECIDVGFTLYEVGQFINISERAVRKHITKV